MPCPRHVLLFALLAAARPAPVVAQGEPVVYAGALAGVAALSGDARAIVSAGGFASSSYDPDNGAALNLLVGSHVGEYVSIQGNYIWNRNDVVLFSGASTNDASRRFSQDVWRTTQHAFVGDLLVYFRERTSRVRPYLSGGLGVVKLDASRIARMVEGSDTPEDGTSTDLVLRVAVGVDVPIGSGWLVRYSFSESLSQNPISERLEPPGTANLMNFQNLVGLIHQF